jgi:protein TonB
MDSGKVKTAAISVFVSAAVHLGAAVVLLGLSAPSPATRDIDVITLDIAKVDFSASGGKPQPESAKASPRRAESEFAAMPPEPAAGADDGISRSPAPADFEIPAVEVVPEPPMPAADAPAPSAADHAGIDAPPKPVTPIRPVYPALSRSRGEEGTVVVEFAVGGDGRPERISIAASSGHPRLDAAAAEAVASARFSPALRDGQPVSSVARIPLVFRLRQRK